MSRHASHRHPGASRPGTYPALACMTEGPAPGSGAQRSKQRIGGYTRRTMLMEVTCRCGWTTRGPKSEVITNIQAHGKSEHGLEVTPDEIRAVWRVVRDDEAPARRRDGRQ